MRVLKYVRQHAQSPRYPDDGGGVSLSGSGLPPRGTGGRTCGPDFGSRLILAAYHRPRVRSFAAADDVTGTAIHTQAYRKTIQEFQAKVVSLLRDGCTRSFLGSIQHPSSPIPDSAGPTQSPVDRQAVW